MKQLREEMNNRRELGVRLAPVRGCQATLTHPNLAFNRLGMNKKLVVNVWVASLEDNQRELLHSRNE